MIFRTSQKKIKRKRSFCRKDHGKNCNPCNQALGRGQRQGGVCPTDSGAGVAGGEGQGVREVQGLEAHLLVCLGAREGDQRGLVGEEQGAAAEVNDDDSVPTRERRG